VLVPEKAKPLRGDPVGRPCPALRALLLWKAGRDGGAAVSIEQRSRL